MLTPEEIRKQGKRLPKSSFDKFGRKGKIKDAQMESFGDGYGEPYNSHRLIFDYLNDELVWTELSDET